MCVSDGDVRACVRVGGPAGTKSADLGELEVSPDEVVMAELLAEGFYGKVYRAEMHGLSVAVKKLKLDADVSRAMVAGLVGGAYREGWRVMHTHSPSCAIRARE